MLPCTRFFFFFFLLLFLRFLFSSSATPSCSFSFVDIPLSLAALYNFRSRFRYQPLAIEMVRRSYFWLHEANGRISYRCSFCGALRRNCKSGKGPKRFPIIVSHKGVPFRRTVCSSSSLLISEPIPVPGNRINLLSRQSLTLNFLCAKFQDIVYFNNDR